MSRFYNPDIDLSSSHNDYRYLYSYDDLNRLTGADYRYGISANGTASTWFDVNGLSYVANGNLKSQSGKFTDIAYDHRNLPIHFYLEGDDELIANYNAEGQRILKESSGGAWSFYITDGMQTLAVIAEEGLSHVNLVGNSTFGRIEVDSTGAITMKMPCGITITVHLVRPSRCLYSTTIAKTGQVFLSSVLPNFWISGCI